MAQTGLNFAAQIMAVTCTDSIFTKHIFPKAKLASNKYKYIMTLNMIEQVSVM